MSPAPAVVKELKDAVRAHKAAEKELARSRKRLHKTVLKAQKSREVTMLEVAEIWGVSRQSLYKMLREMS